MIYKCKNCGGNVMYHPDRKKMYCPHCDGIDTEEEIKSSQITECANCGAPVEVSRYTSACKCEHCGSYMILEERVEGEKTPHLILPFQISKDKAVKLLEKEFQNRYYTPATFLSAATLEGMEGIYVPFFLYDYLANMDYAGTGTKVRSWRRGNTEYVETSYFRVERNLEIDFDRIPVDASINMDDAMMDLLEPFDQKALEKFQIKYMSGFQGEVFSEGLMDLEPKRCGGDAAGDALGLYDAACRQKTSESAKTDCGICAFTCVGILLQLPREEIYLLCEWAERKSIGKDTGFKRKDAGLRWRSLDTSFQYNDAWQDDTGGALR